MTRDEAIKTLKPLARKLLRNVYDEMTQAQSDAVFTLVPNFEYPDWDWKRVAALYNETA